MESKRDIFNTYVFHDYGAGNVVRSDFYDVVHLISGEKLSDMTVPVADLTLYRKFMLSSFRHKLKDFVNKDFPMREFSEKEIEENRILEGKYSGMKLTKYLNKMIEQHSRLPFHSIKKEIDVFHKPIEKDTEYYISGDPLKMLDAYYKVETCISPEGENMATAIQYLASPYVYVVYSKNLDKRATLFIDPHRKIVSMGRIYGRYSAIMELSIFLFFHNNGYEITSNGWQYWDDLDEILYYCDSFTFLYEVYQDFFNIKKPEAGEIISLFKMPENLYGKITHDAVTGNLFLDNTQLTTAEKIKSFSSGFMNSDEYFCMECGFTVNEDEFDFDYEMCCECSNHMKIYCYECGNDVDQDFFDFNHDCCESCSIEIQEKQAEKEEALLNEDEKAEEII